MKAFEDFVIDNPYELSEDDKEAISKAMSTIPQKCAWDSKTKGIVALKESIREYLYEKQNGLCAYCRHEIDLGTSFEHIEHIIHKDNHPQWMFIPKNLCMACEVCNTNKGTKETMSNPTSTTYPRQSKDFIIVNPYLDKYSDHIEIEGDIIYKGTSEKGKKTIEYCNLARITLVVENAKEKITEEHNDELLGDLLNLLKQNYKEDDCIKIEKRIKTEISIWKRKQFHRTRSI